MNAESRHRRCIPCTAATPRLDASAAESLLRELDGWRINPSGHLAKQWRTDDFASALELVGQIAAIAEEQNHHPEVTFGWGHVEVELWTHAIDGLSENDFILAEHIDSVAG